MTKRLWITLVLVSSIVSFLPIAAFAGAGGSPPAPGAAAAGNSTAYCCTGSPKWTTVQIGLKGEFTVFHGNACTVVTDPNTECSSGEVRKCRGEFFTPAAGTVERCFSP